MGMEEEEIRWAHIRSKNNPVTSITKYSPKPFYFASSGRKKSSISDLYDKIDGCLDVLNNIKRSVDGREYFSIETEISRLEMGIDRLDDKVFEISKKMSRLVLAVEILLVFILILFFKNLVAN